MKNINRFGLLIAVFITSMFFSFGANAAQCIYNNSGTSLNVQWKNTAGGIDKNASNSNLTVGQKACQNNGNLGYAVIQCNACKFAANFTKAAVGVAGGVAIIACVAATAGECLLEAPALIAVVEEVVRAIPNGDQRHYVLVPNKGQTMQVKGNAFGLELQ